MFASSKIYNLVSRLASNYSSTSSSFDHIAYIMINGKVVASGTNDSLRTGTQLCKNNMSIHAEHSALFSFLKQQCYLQN